MGCDDEWENAAVKKERDCRVIKLFVIVPNSTRQIFGYVATMSYLQARVLFSTNRGSSLFHQRRAIKLFLQQRRKEAGLKNDLKKQSNCMQETTPTLNNSPQQSTETTTTNEATNT